MTDTSDERALAARLAGLDDAGLVETFASRGVSPRSSWRDFFDAAEALLDAASLDRTLSELSRTELRALTEPVVPAGVRPSLRLRALVDDDGRPFGAAAARAAAVRAADPGAFAPDTPEPMPGASDPTQEAASAERALVTLGALADVLLALERAPITRTGGGTVTAVDRRRLLDSGAVTSAQDLDDLLAAAGSAALVRAGEREWTPTAAAESWLGEGTPARWVAVVSALAAHLPEALRGVPFASARTWDAAYPRDSDWPETSERWRRLASAWGLLAADGTEPVWAVALREGATPDPALLARHLPAEIDRVYLQADLSAIAPGPLAPALDVRLRTMAERESRAQASTYRFSEGSLGRAVGQGETAASIRTFLEGLSLTGVPQPLAYLIDSVSSRHGLIRVRTDAATGLTRVDAADAALRRTVSVDQALRAVGLVEDGDVLVSRAARDAVYWALLDARYPAIAVDDDGTAEPLHRRRAASDSPSGTEAPFATLIAALRASVDTGTDAAWLGRELEQAVRTRSTIRVTVRLPDGSEREFVLEASGFGGGRLRGRDHAADVERTLPLSHIISVAPA